MAPTKRKCQSKTFMKPRKRKNFVSVFVNVPEEVILLIASFLRVDDVARLSLTCSRLYEILSRASAPWKKGFTDNRHPISTVLAQMSSLEQPSAESGANPLSKEKHWFLIHKKVERNFARTSFSRPLAVAYWRPDVLDSRVGQNVVTLLKIGLFNFEITVWSPITKEKRMLMWSAPPIYDYHKLSSVFSFQDIIAVHLVDSNNKNIIFGLNIGASDVNIVWQKEMPVSLSLAMWVQPVGDVIVIAFLPGEIKELWDLNLVEYKTGQVLKEFRIDAVLLNSLAGLHNHDLLVLPAVRWIYDIRERRNGHTFEFTVVNVKDKTLGFLAPVPDSLKDLLSCHVGHGKVFAHFEGNRISVWDLKSRHHLQTFSLPEDSFFDTSKILGTPYSLSKGQQIFVKTVKNMQMSSKSRLEYTMFECPTQGSGNQEFDIDPSRSFNFGSRSQLRRISPEEVLAAELVFRHFVVVFLKNRVSKTELYVAVMSNNSNNDLGNLKVTKLEERKPDLLRNDIRCQITPSHIIIAYQNEMVVFDFTLN